MHNWTNSLTRSPPELSPLSAPIIERISSTVPVTW
jgi:hypothetical protein